jgi:catechol 2,3-dioxygenase-like lactoylglutathione lyase family enzyme
MIDSPGMALVQVALSSMHLVRSHDWYCRALGFVPAGPRRKREVPGRGLVSGLPEAALDVWCLMGHDDWMQFEMFEFTRPRMRSLPTDWRPSDIGYSTIGIFTTDFEAAIDRIRRTSGRLLTNPIGDRGDRRVALRDPDGILLELIENDVRTTHRIPRPDVPVGVRFVTMSVPDLQRSKQFWCNGLGFTETAMSLHNASHDALWGLSDVVKDSTVIAVGSYFIELVQYHRPVARWRPAGCLFSDQGILNVAIGTSHYETFLQTYRRAVAAGYHAQSEPYSEKGASVVYLSDHDGVSVELLHASEEALEEIGFVPATE